MTKLTVKEYDDWRERFYEDFLLIKESIEIIKQSIEVYYKEEDATYFRKQWSFDIMISMIDGQLKDIKNDKWDYLYFSENTIRVLLHIYDFLKDLSSETKESSLIDLVKLMISNIIIVKHRRNKTF